MPRLDPIDGRGLAQRVLLRVERGGAYASTLLDHHGRALSDPREAALARELVLGVLRRRPALDHALGRVASRPLSRTEPPVRAALRLAAYEILFLSRVPDYAAVDSAVERVRRGGHGRAAGYCNAVLRALARGGSELLPPPPREGDVDGLARHQAHPRWWTARVVERWGWGAAGRLLAANNRPAPQTLRPALPEVTPEELARLLAKEGVTTEPGRLVPEALRVVDGNASRAAALQSGLAWVQDEASQLVARMLGGRVGPRVLDACAAPGGKTLMLARALVPEGCVVACDLRPSRLARLHENLERTRTAGVLMLAADMTEPPLRGSAQQVLVDAPCTGTGTLRRHPEIRWRLRPGDPARLAKLQARLLEAAARRVAPGGTLVYAVCSLEPEEGAQVVKRFLARHRAFALEDPREHLPLPARERVDAEGFLRTSPAAGETDGFFAARLLRRRL